uniref:Uncharacterized protein n=1 Tax=Oryza sativa subsp. japonica TaxID=39947 RepID=Q6EUG5_ORYSJ|nr:hypothetical protein [Oryza sativa Japonica Group]
MGQSYLSLISCERRTEGEVGGGGGTPHASGCGDAITWRSGGGCCVGLRRRRHTAEWLRGAVVAAARGTGGGGV